MEERQSRDVRSFTVDEMAAIDKLKVRMKDFPNIHFQTDQRFLVKYLYFCDWDTEKAIQMIIKIYQTRVRLKCFRATIKNNN